MNLGSSSSFLSSPSFQFASLSPPEPTFSHYHYPTSTPYYNHHYNPYYSIGADQSYQWTSSSSSSYDSAYYSSSSSSTTTQPYYVQSESIGAVKRPASQDDDNDNDDDCNDVAAKAAAKERKRPRVQKYDCLASPSKSTPLSQTMCQLCGIDFESVSRCLMHTHRMHQKRDPTQCPICHKKFGSQANALTHLKAHTQEKNYKCDFCSLAFCDSSTLKKHKRTHTGEKPFVCRVCGKSFTQSGNLKRHLSIHIKSGGGGGPALATDTAKSDENDQQPSSNLEQPQLNESTDRAETSACQYAFLRYQPANSYFQSSSTSTPQSLNFCHNSYISNNYNFSS